MSSGERMPYERAKMLADRFVSIIEPYCLKVDIAGSVRRCKRDIGDIEIVCLPKLAGQPGLFPGFVTEFRLPDFVNILKEKFFIEKGNLEDGRYVKLMAKKDESLKIDLFMPSEHDYYRILAIRTGSKGYSGQVIAGGWVALGWVGTPDGLRRADQCKESGGGWVCTEKNPELPPAWESEEKFFKWLKVKYVEPQNREVYDKG